MKKLTKKQIQKRAKEIIDGGLAIIYRDENRLCASPDGLDGFTIATFDDEVNAEVFAQLASDRSKADNNR